MADIVERLRSVTRLMRKTEEVTYHQDDGLALEAADEITALRAENERLRAALKKAGQTYPADGSRLIHSQQQIIDIARAALEGKP